MLPPQPFKCHPVLELVADPPHLLLVTAKAARRRGGQPRPGYGQGQPAREADVARRGSSPQGRPALRSQPAGAAAARRHTCLQHDTCKGGRLQGARKGLPSAGATTLATGVATLGRVAADGQGQPLPAQGQHQRLRQRRWGKRG
ncbi:hypothetical protein BHE74_00033327 [Ensete ventricosum]|nr:hypothetical protein BHE74_00033327 [Ensete ventricosum]